MLPPKRILELREVDREEAEGLGAPTGKAFDSLFGASCNALFAIHFEKILESDRPKDFKLIQKSEEAMAQIKGRARDVPTIESKEMDLDELFVPDSKIEKDPEKEAEAKGREVQIPSNLLKRFVEHAWPSSPAEYMGWITGTMEKEKKSGKNILYANGLFFPLQDSNSWTVWEKTGAGAPTALLAHMDSTGSQIIGWIHSHPTFDSFFSSLDQHTQYTHQRDMPMFFGLVVDKEKKVRCMRLSEAGMKAVEECGNHSQERVLVALKQFQLHSNIFLNYSIYMTKPIQIEDIPLHQRVPNQLQ